MPGHLGTRGHPRCPTPDYRAGGLPPAIFPDRRVFAFSVPIAPAAQRLTLRISTYDQVRRAFPVPGDGRARPGPACTLMRRVLNKALALSA